MPGLLNPAQLASDDASLSLPLGLNEDELDFYRKVTGIGERGTLVAHISASIREASEIVRGSTCLDLVLAHLPGYDKVLKVGRNRKNPLFLSIGSGSVDVRKAIVDGYPSDCIIATDRYHALWAIGERLFDCVGQKTAPIPFLSGDLLDPYFLEAVWPFYTTPYAPPPTLTTLKSLNPLHGQVSVISVCHIFDKLDRSQQLQLARGIAGLLSAESGSMVIGVHSTGSVESGMDRSSEPFSHSPTTWSDLWDGQLFQRGTVKVETRLVRSTEVDMSDGGHVMEWTVVRL